MKTSEKIILAIVAFLVLISVATIRDNGTRCESNDGTIYGACEK